MSIGCVDCRIISPIISAGAGLGELGEALGMNYCASGHKILTLGPGQ